MADNRVADPKAKRKALIAVHGSGGSLREAFSRCVRIADDAQGQHAPDMTVWCRDSGDQ